jgi:hypothetical protein
MILLASSYGAFGFFFSLFFFFSSFPTEGVSGYWFCGFLAARGMSPAMRFLLCFNSVVFYLVLDLCVLARIYATRASLWWSWASFSPVVTSHGHVSPLFGAWPTRADELPSWSYGWGSCTTFPVSGDDDLDCERLSATRRDPDVGTCSTHADSNDDFPGAGCCWIFYALYIPMCLLWIIVCLLVMHKCFISLFGVCGRLNQLSYFV